MKAISLKLPDTLVATSEQCAEALGLSRAEYIRQAIEHMNVKTRNALRTRRIQSASQKVRKESMRVNAEFAATERDPNA